MTPADLRKLALVDLLIRCDVCGRFIPYSDLESGKAYRHMVTPDSDYSSETYESLCKDHKEAQP